MWGIPFVLATVYAFYYSKKLKETAKNKQGELASYEVLHILIPEIFSPIFAGAIYYYSWKKSMPRRASQANKYSWIIFGVMILMGMMAGFSARRY